MNDEVADECIADPDAAANLLTNIAAKEIFCFITRLNMTSRWRVRATDCYKSWRDIFLFAKFVLIEKKSEILIGGIFVYGDKNRNSLIVFVISINFNRFDGN